MTREIYACDLETTGLDRFKDRILGIGVYRPDASHFFSDVASFELFLEANPNAQFVFHRGGFDVGFLRNNGVDLRLRWLADSHSISSIVIPGCGLAEGEESERSLQNLGIKYLGLEPWKLDRENMEGYSLDEIKAYCLKDCKVTYDLYEHFMKILPERSKTFIESWLMPATKFCADLEYNGVYIDAEGLKVYRTEVEKQRDGVLGELREMALPAIKFYHEMQVREVSDRYKEMYEKAKAKAKDKEKCHNRYAELREHAVSKIQPFNWNSSKQLKWLLRDYYQLDITRVEWDPKTKQEVVAETTDEAMLRSLDHPVAKKLCDYRELEKLCSTCIPALLENLAPDQNVHANYNVGGTRTGRLSSSGPNLQQIPKGKIRSYIQATPGQSLVTIDYAQIEVRIIAELAHEEELIHAFEEGIDPYSVIAQKLLKIETPVREIKEKHKKERDVSKTAGLSILYGTGAAKLQEVLRKDLGRNYSLNECKQFINDYRESLPGVKELRKRLDRALANGKVCHNLLGRPFCIDSNDNIYMKGLNTLVQGSASDLVIWSQTQFVIPVLRELGVDFKHRMVIHDEVVIELPKNEAELLVHEVIVPAMTTQAQSALGLTVPLKVEWALSDVWEKP